MRQRPTIALALFTLAVVAFFTACGGRHRYDGRLVTADSLMRDCPDSTLAIVEGLCRDSLATEGDRAYRDLLLTQARYRCYVTATSDSDINRALAYYRAHPKEREKLTRANIYKGAVMDELGFPDSAMLYYKQAEAVADPTDYFNLGYINMRIGALYRENHVMDGKDIVYYEKALQYFNKTEKITYQLMCLVNLGSLYCLTAPHKADSLLKKSLSVAETIGDTSRYILAMENLIKNDIHIGSLEEAQRLIQKVLSMNTQFESTTFYLSAASVYANLNMPDSAEILLTMAESKTISTDLERLAYLDAKRDIARARGDNEASRYYDQLGDHLEGSLYFLDTPLRITSMEDSVVEQSHHIMKKKHESLVWKMLLLAIAMLAVLALLLSVFVKKYRYKKLATELSHSYLSQSNELTAHQEKIKALDIRDSELKDFITSNINMMREMIDECYSGANVKQLKNKIEEIVKFQQGKDSQWLKLFSYIDLEYGNIITTTRHNFPQLSEKDLMLLALTTLDCSCIQIATILGYSNITSVGPIRQRLAKKMNLDGSLMTYIQQFKTT